MGKFFKFIKEFILPEELQEAHLGKGAFAGRGRKLTFVRSSPGRKSYMANRIRGIKKPTLLLKPSTVEPINNSSWSQQSTHIPDEFGHKDTYSKDGKMLVMDKATKEHFDKTFGNKMSYDDAYHMVNPLGMRGRVTATIGEKGGIKLGFEGGMGLHPSLRKADYNPEDYKYKFNYELNPDSSLNINHARVPKFMQQEGIFRNFMNKSLEHWQKLGINNVNLLADMEVGGYAMAKFGFDFAKPQEMEKYKKAFAEHLKKNNLEVDQTKLEHSWDIAGTKTAEGRKIGKEFMLEHSKSQDEFGNSNAWSAKLDLTNPLHTTQFKSYINSKAMPSELLQLAGITSAHYDATIKNSSEKLIKMLVVDKLRNPLITPKAMHNKGRELIQQDLDSIELFKQNVETLKKAKENFKNPDFKELLQSEIDKALSDIPKDFKDKYLADTIARSSKSGETVNKTMVEPKSAGNEFVDRLLGKKTDIKADGTESTINPEDYYTTKLQKSKTKLTPEEFNTEQDKLDIEKNNEVNYINKLAELDDDIVPEARKEAIKKVLGVNRKHLLKLAKSNPDLTDTTIFPKMFSETVNTNLWGVSNVQTPEGEKYFPTVGLFYDAKTNKMMNKDIITGKTSVVETKTSPRHTKSGILSQAANGINLAKRREATKVEDSFAVAIDGKANNDSDPIDVSSDKALFEVKLIGKEASQRKVSTNEKKLLRKQKVVVQERLDAEEKMKTENLEGFKRLRELQVKQQGHELSKDDAARFKQLKKIKLPTADDTMEIDKLYTQIQKGKLTDAEFTELNKLQPKTQRDLWMGVKEELTPKISQYYLYDGVGAFELYADKPGRVEVYDAVRDSKGNPVMEEDKKTKSLTPKIRVVGEKDITRYVADTIEALQSKMEKLGLVTPDAKNKRETIKARVTSERSKATPDTENEESGKTKVYYDYLKGLQLGMVIGGKTWSIKNIREKMRL